MTRLLAAGVIGPPVFALVSLVLGATRTAYDPVRTFLSQLSLNGGGGWQVANLVAVGVSILASGFGLRRVVTAGPASLWGSRWVRLAGLGFVGIGVFRDDPWLSYPPGAPSGIGPPRSRHGAVHLLSSAVAGSGLWFAMLTFLRRFAAERDTAWIGYTVASASLFPGFYAAALASGLASADPANPLGGRAGLFQRLSVFTALAWIAALACRSLRMRPADGRGGVPTPSRTGTD